MNKKYKTLLLTISIFLAIIVIICGGYLIYNYNKSKNQAEVIIDKELSINYLSGRSINFSKKQKEIQFSIINDSDESSMFSISLENLEVESSKVTYNLFENNKNVGNNKKIKKAGNIDIYNFVEIDENSTKSYKLIINNPEKLSVKFKINIYKSYNEENNFSQIVLNNNTINKETKSKAGYETAVTDEGLIQDVDDLGNTFYFRGSVENNYVSFADRTWRIVRINGDGTIKLILNDSVDKSTIYASNKSISLDNLKNIKNNTFYEKLDSWYNNNLKEYDDYISVSKFCIDTSKEGEVLNNYNRISTINNPTFNCFGTKTNSKIGLLTVDEIIYAGGIVNSQNDHYYLYNPTLTDSWWTISPVKEAVEGIYYYEVTINGSLVTTSTGESTKNLRPVINLNKNVQVTGTGTKEDPYVLK